MRTSTTIWLLLLIAGGGFLAFRTVNGAMGRAYVRHETFDAKASFEEQIRKIDQEEQKAAAKGDRLSKKKADARKRLQTRLPDVAEITWTKTSPAERDELTTDDGQVDPAVVFSW